MFGICRLLVCARKFEVKVEQKVVCKTPRYWSNNFSLPGTQHSSDPPLLCQLSKAAADIIEETSLRYLEWRNAQDARKADSLA